MYTVRSKHLHNYPPPRQIFVAEIAEAEHRGLLLGLTVPVMAAGVLAVYGLGGSGHSV